MPVTITRRDLIQRFGLLAFVLSPVARSMGQMAPSAFAGAPRFVMFFKGGSFHPPSMKTSAITDLASTPIAALAPHASDLVLFQGMRIHGGEPKSDGYMEEHGAGLMGCVTGHSYKYSRNDSYYVYTDHESIDIAIANHYQTVPALAKLPFASLQIGAGAHSDADNVGLGQRYISFRNRQAGDAQYGNAYEPVQDAGQVYDKLMQRIGTLCGKASNQPLSDNTKLEATLRRKQSVLDFRMADIADAKRALGMDSEHARKLDGLVDGWRDVESSVQAELGAASGGVSVAQTQSCPDGARPTGNGQNQLNCDLLSPVHDQMIALIKLAFAWDLTRVVAYTLSGASSGQRLPSQGVNQAHHTLEHSNNVAGLNIMGRFYAEKFAGLLSALKSIDDGNGQSGLYNSSVLLGMECWSDSSSGHYLTDIPFILAGQGAGAFKTGRIVQANGRSNNDLLVSIQNASGIPSGVFGLESLCKGPIV
jgi:Protein of unknown function (DUF1552)